MQCCGDGESAASARWDVSLVCWCAGGGGQWPSSHHVIAPPLLIIPRQQCNPKPPSHLYIGSHSCHRTLPHTQQHTQPCRTSASLLCECTEWLGVLREPWLKRGGGGQQVASFESCVCRVHPPPAVPTCGPALASTLLRFPRGAETCMAQWPRVRHNFHSFH